MGVTMMYVRKMRMPVRNRCMPMRMAVRLFAVPSEVVLMLMMRVVPMPMRVIQRVMRVRMLVPFADMQPDAQCHERGGDPERRRRHVRPQQPRQGHAEQRR